MFNSFGATLIEKIKENPACNFQNILNRFQHCCGAEAICFGSGAGFHKVSAPATASPNGLSFYRKLNKFLVCTFFAFFIYLMLSS
jgi:hypothetical protein